MINQKSRYNRIWRRGEVLSPKSWSLWATTKDFQGKRNLELGPGNHPRIPVKNGFFLDISDSAIENLKKLGGKGVVGNAASLPFENEFFDLVVALEVLEHAKDDKRAFTEIARVLKPLGFFLFSVPTGKHLYNEFDKVTGHERRYEIKDLKVLLLKSGFKILRYRPPSSYLKMLDKWFTSLPVKKVLLRGKGYETFFNLPGFLVNLYWKIYAFLERKGAYQWRTDIENLSKQKEEGIILFCQKI